MKKLYILALACFSSNALLAQTANGGQILPVIGEQFRTHSVTNATMLNTGYAGLNQTWDFTALQYDQSDTGYFQVVAPAGTPFKDSFPSSTIVMKSYSSIDPSYIRYEYYIQTGNQNNEQLSDLGSMMTGFSFINSTPELLYNLPINFGDSSGGPFCYHSLAFSIAHNYCGESHMKFDGTGTLELPYGNFSNVYRFHYSNYEINTAVTGDTSFISRYYWYKPGLHKALLEYTIFSDNTGYADTSSLILDAKTALGIKNTVSTISFNVYPNPAKDMVHIALEKEWSGEVKLSNCLGQILIDLPIKGQQQIDVNTRGLPGGMYILELNSADGIATKKITILP